MGRNKRQRRNRKNNYGSRHNNNKEEVDEENNNGTTTAVVTLNTIEEDLRQQRLRQQEKKQCQLLREQQEQEQREQQEEEKEKTMKRIGIRRKSLSSRRTKGIFNENNDDDQQQQQQPFTPNPRILHSTEDRLSQLYHRGIPSYYQEYDNTILPTTTTMRTTTTIPPGASATSSSSLSFHSLVWGYAQELGTSSSSSSSLLSVIQLNHPYRTQYSTVRNTSRIRHVWYSQYLLQQLQIYSKALTLYSKAKWSMYQLPQYGWYCPWDLTCKYYNHPSARTLDVLTMGIITPTTGTSSSSSYPLPTIVSAVQGGFLLCQPGSSDNNNNRNDNDEEEEEEDDDENNEDSTMNQHQNNQRRQRSRVISSNPRRWRQQQQQQQGHVHTIRGEPVHAVRLYHSKNNNGYTNDSQQRRGYIGTLTSSGAPSSTSGGGQQQRRRRYSYATSSSSSSSSHHQLKLYDINNGHVFANETLHIPVNDLCFGQDLILLAPSRTSTSTGGGDRLVPLFLPLRQEGGGGGGGGHDLRTLQIDNFPQSDALRVEISCHEKLVAFGHRNGQVSLLDLRNSTSCCGVTSLSNPSSNPPAAAEEEIGSATDLALIPSQQQLVVKHSFGTCQLHDLRKLSSVSTRTHGTRNQTTTTTRGRGSQSSSSSLVWNMIVPEKFHCHKMKSSRCNGLVLDHPTNYAQMVLAPYMNTNNDSCLGFWSLRTGMFLGSKQLLKGRIKDNKDDNDNDDGDDVIYTELCQQTTPAYYSLDNNNNNNNNNSSSSSCPSQKQQQHSRAFQNRSSSSIPSSSSSSSSSFGIWLKCGRFSKNGTNSKSGSLHHIVIPGKWEIEERS